MNLASKPKLAIQCEVLVHKEALVFSCYWVLLGCIFCVRKMLKIHFFNKLSDSSMISKSNGSKIFLSNNRCNDSYWITVLLISGLKIEKTSLSQEHDAYRKCLASCHFLCIFQTLLIDFNFWFKLKNVSISYHILFISKIRIGLQKFQNFSTRV